MRVSQLVKVRALALALGLVLVPSLAVLNAPLANAVDVLTPVNFPGSAYAPGVTGDHLTRWNRSNPGSTKMPIPASVPNNGKVGIRPGAVGAAGGVAVTFLAGLELGTGAASLLGLPTSGNFVCDLATAVAGSQCGVVPGPEYTPNLDVPTSANGFTHGNIVGNYLVAISSTHLYGGAGNLTISATYLQSLTECKLGVPSPDPFYFRSIVTTGGSFTGSTRTGCSKKNDEFVWTDGESSQVVDSRFKGIDFFAGPSSSNPVVTSWLTVGNPERPEDVHPDPLRRWRTDWLCSTGGPGSAFSSAFRESASDWPAFPSAQCSAGAIPTKVTWWQVTEGMTDTMLSEWDLPDNVSDWATDNPDCAGGGCQLLLQRLDQVTGKQYSCFSNPSMCQDWFEDPAKTQNYRCTYGGTEVPLKECNLYRITFNVGTEGDLSDPDPENPDPQPPVSPEPPGQPDPEGPKRDDACPPPFTWTSLMNPWWYYKGMTCALQSALVPSTSGLQSSVGKVRTAWAATSPAKWAAAVGGTFDGVAVQEAGCAGPRLKWDYAQLDFYPFSACEEPMRTWAGWVKGFLSAAIVFTGAFAAFRAVGSGLGWKPSAGGDS